MTSRPPLDPADLKTFRALQAQAPFRTSLPFTRSTPITDVGGVLDWLASYVRHVDKQVTTLRSVDVDRARAAVVLRGLRMDLANAVSTLADLDAAVESGALDAATLLPVDTDD